MNKVELNTKLSGIASANNNFRNLKHYNAENVGNMV